MPRSCVASTQCILCVPRNARLGVSFLIALVIGGCGNSCFIGVSNNGNGTLVVKAGNPPPACSLNQVQAGMRVAIVRSPVCEVCTPSARITHLFVTLRGIQLHPGVAAEPNSVGWVEITPQLANEPLLVDLIGASAGKIDLEGARVPAGPYRQVRLQFLSDSSVGAEVSLTKAVCGSLRSNCVVLGDGRIEPLLFARGERELLLAAQNLEDGSFLVLPDKSNELRLHLDPRQVFLSSAAEPWKPQVLLVGRAAILREPTQP